MAKPRETKEDLLQRIKDNIKESHDYFRDNYDMFYDMMNFVFCSSVSEDEREKAAKLGRGVAEFNVVRSQICAKRGEFAEIDPDIKVGSADGSQVDPKLIEFLEGHIRYIRKQAEKELFGYEVYTDLTGGGFSAAEVVVDYAHEMSMEQVISIKKTTAATLTGFDPTAKLKDKSDGKYCYSLSVMRKKEFEEEFGDKNWELTAGNIGGFSLEFKTKLNEDIILIASYYEKVKKKVRIFKLSNGEVMTQEAYKTFLENWAIEEALGLKLEAAPVVVGKPRWTTQTAIKRYLVCEGKLLREEDTIFERLPITYIDGDSVIIANAKGSSYHQVTTPMMKFARDAQRLKNLSGQMLINDIERTIQAVFLIANESIPEGWAMNYKNPQLQQSLVYNQYTKDDQKLPLNPPMVLQRQQTPNTITDTFMTADMVIQACTGSMDASVAKFGNQDISGKAMDTAVSLGQGAAKPYMVSFINGSQSIYTTILSLIPKVYVTPASAPIITVDGKTEFVMLNQEGGVSTEYDYRKLNVDVSIGPNFRTQQKEALEQIFAGMQVNEAIKMAFSGEKGLPILIDNMNMRGKDQFKEVCMQVGAEMEAARKQAMQVQQQMMQQQQGQPNAEMAYVQVEAQKAQSKSQIDMLGLQLKAQKDAAELDIKQQQLDLDRKALELKEREMMLDLQIAKVKAHAEISKADDARDMSRAELAIKVSEHHNGIRERAESREDMRKEKEGKTDDQG